MTNREYLDVALKAARAAEKIVMSYYGAEKKITHKGQADLVTKADLESEKKIVSSIKQNYPEHGFILEEGKSTPEKEFMWIIDPIDGTTSFAHNYPMFSISVALYRKKAPVLGVVLIPCLNEIFHAVVGEGAFLNNNKIKVSDVLEIRKSLVATGFPYTRVTSGEDNLNYFSAMAKIAQGLRRSGSAAIDICYVAAGRADAYWEIGLKIMDTAAARIVLEEAGGKFTDFLGSPIK